MTAQVPARGTEQALEQPRDGWRSLSEQEAPQGVQFAGRLPGLIRSQGEK